MSKKVRKDVKRDLLLDERNSLLNDVDSIDTILDVIHELLNKDLSSTDATQAEDIHAKANALREQLMAKTSFASAIEWLQPFIQHSLLGLQNKLNSLTDVLDQEFPRPTTLEDFEKQGSGLQLLEQVKATSIIKLYLDSSLILYALGRNGAAIVELHSVLERQAIEKLAKVILLPEKIDIGRRTLDRLTLKDLASMLQDCGILDKDDIKFVEKISKLRNGLAHRNPTGVSNAMLSGQALLEVEIDSVLSELDYISYAISAIRFLIKVLDWEESEIVP